jgi:hypothetical protein
VPISAFERSPLNGVVVADLTFGDGSTPPADFSVTIDWGDGSTSAGVVVPQGGQYAVQGSHDYLDERTYHLTVLAGGPGPTTASATTEAMVLEELLPDGTRGTANERFVSEVYRDLLRRQVDPVGLANWTALLDSGVSQVRVVEMIETGPGNEYRTLEVNDLYEQYLGRQADPMGLSNALALLASGGSAEQVAAGIVASDEYLAGHGGGSTDGFLEALYRDALGRDIDPTALTDDRAALLGGLSRQELALNLFAGQEYRDRLIDAIYRNVLDRPVDEVGLANFAPLPALGFTDEQVIARIVGNLTNEFFDKTAP